MVIVFGACLVWVGLYRHEFGSSFFHFACECTLIFDLI